MAAAELKVELAYEAAPDVAGLGQLEDLVVNTAHALLRRSHSPPPLLLQGDSPIAVQRHPAMLMRSSEKSRAW